MIRRHTHRLPQSWRALTATLLSVACIVALGVPEAMAASGVTMLATGTETGRWSSNPLLAPSGATSLWGSTTSPEFTLDDAGDSSDFSFDGRVDQNQFNQSAFNSTDGHAINSLLVKNERWQISSQQNADYDTTRTSTNANFGLTPIIAHHVGLSVQPQISFAPTAVDVLSLQGSVLSSHYDSLAFTNYETFSATPGILHHFDPRNAMQVTFETQRYQATRSSSLQVDSLGPQVGWLYTFSQRFNANMSMGAQTSRSFQPGAPATPWTWQYVFGGGLNFQGQQDAIALNTSRNQYPYGNGTEALQTSISATESHALTPLFNVTAGGAYLSSQYQISSPGSQHSLLTGSAGLVYHATEQVDVTAAYQYRHETLEGTTATATDNAATLSVALHPKIWTLSP